MDWIALPALRQLDGTLRKHFTGVSRLKWIGQPIASGRQGFPRILECGSQEVSCLGIEGLGLCNGNGSGSAHWNTSMFFGGSMSALRAVDNLVGSGRIE